MQITLALDIYGTLIDPLAIKTALAEHAGEKATGVAETWRTKQLEYSFRRGLMGVYRDFSHVTSNALDYACLVHDIQISDTGRTTLLNLYRELDAFPDTAPALTALHDEGVNLCAFSNGVADDINALLQHNTLDSFIQSVVSADEIHTFKPDPQLYGHFLHRTGATAVNTVLVSSNPFDIIGAAACGWQTVWVQRNKSVVFDPWELEPTAIVTELPELVELLPALLRQG